MSKAWWKERVVYQIYPRSFYDSNGDGIGDLAGITLKLPYLKELGIGIIWLSPIFKSPNHDNGYDISDYRAIMDEFGTMEDFDNLLNKAHKLDIKIILDLVSNHTSDEHPWFIESRKSKNNPYRDYYIWRDGKNSKKGEKGDPPNNWESFFRGSVWEYDETTCQYYLHLFAKQQPDLNWENETVRKEIYNMMTWWFKKGIDGFRMDTINMISKVPGLPDGEIIPNTPYGDRTPYMINGPRVHEFLQEMNREVLSKYDVMTVGETPFTDVQTAALYTDPARNEINMLFQFEHMEADYQDGGQWSEPKLDFLKLKQTFFRWQTGLNGKGWNSLYWNNHDQARAVSRFGNDGIYRVLSAKMLGACLHMMQGTPYIYQGEELGMTNVAFESIDDYDDIETKNSFVEYTQNRGVAPKDMMRYIWKRSRDNARTPMQWTGSENGGFTVGKPWLKLNPNYTSINAETQINDPNSVFSFYKELIRIRNNYDIVVYGDFNLLLPEDPQIFAYERMFEGNKLLTVCNFGETAVNFDFPEYYKLDNAKLLIANYEDCQAEPSISLRPYEARVYLFNLG